MAALSVSGRMVGLPSFLRAPDTSRGDSASCFALGVFPGIANSCCAPVLAGVMTLSALSGSVAGGISLGLAYTFGMTCPLLVMALLWDRLGLGERRMPGVRPIRLRLGRRVLATNAVNLAVALAFTVMGGFVIGLATSGQMSSGTGFQAGIGRGLANAFERLETWAEPVPEPLVGLALLAAAAVFVVATLRDRPHPPPASEADDAHCHPPEPTSSTRKERPEVEQGR